jgi:hypothetical protein
VSASQSDPERILNEVDQQLAATAEAKTRADVEHARRNRLYEAVHRVEVYDNDNYSSEYGKPPISDNQFCQAWAGHIVTLASVLAADGW